jgi:hypothetical protein
MNASESNSLPSGTKKIIEFPEREETPEERAAEKERSLAYSKTSRARWRRFWCDIDDGRKHWRRSVWRVWGTDSQDQKHNLGMESADTPEKAIEVCRDMSAYRDPRVLAYRISATRLPQDKSIGERIGNFISASTWFVLRLVIFIILSYGIDYTPLAIHRIVAYFHLNQVEGLFLALFYLVILWNVANWLRGVLLPVGKRTVENVETLLFLMWIVPIIWLLNTHHYLFAGFVFLVPEWNWDGSFMTRQRWFLAQGLCRMIWFAALTVHLIYRWL